MNGLTNATSKDTAWCPKHQIVKTVLSVRHHYPKRGRFTENLSIYLFSPAPNSPLENPSNFGATTSHWLLYILLFFFFLILIGWMRGALCVATHLYILYQAADESTSGCEFFGNSKIATYFFTENIRSCNKSQKKLNIKFSHFGWNIFSYVKFKKCFVFFFFVSEK